MDYHRQWSFKDAPSGLNRREFLFYYSQVVTSTPCLWRLQLLLSHWLAGPLLSSAGNLTNRWPLTIPIIPMILLQALRQKFLPLTASPTGSLQACAISGFSAMFACVSAMLSILFPAVELPTITGPFNVGIVEFYLPVAIPANNIKTKEHLPVRILYPTNESNGGTGIPYLNELSAIDYCNQFMRIGAPPSLQKYPLGWVLHAWRLTRLKVHPSAPLAETESKHSSASASLKFPVVVFSHGLMGHADTYSYQTVSLAAQGYIVLVLTHLDGSAPAVRKVDGTILKYDTSLSTLSGIDYLQARRQQTEYRADEMIAATEALLALDCADPSRPVTFGDKTIPSFRQRLKHDQVFFMGHSYGGATALAAAHRCPELVRAVVAHDPALDWLPNATRRSLLDASRWLDLSDLRAKYAKNEFKSEDWTDNDARHTNTGKSSIHDLEMLILFSGEWREKRLMCPDIVIEMYNAHRLGPNTKAIEAGNSVDKINAGSTSISETDKKSTEVFKRVNNSSVDVIESAHHIEFEDTSMMLPLWMSRMLGMTGTRNPCETAAEISHRTRVFLLTVRQAGRIQ
jgi:pimeloyl-ACP methyl ester carboxylesterase